MENMMNNQAPEVQNAVNEALKAEKAKKKKKRLIILAVIAGIIILIVAISSLGGSDDKNTSNNNTNNTTSSSSSVSAEKEEGAEGKIGSYVCTVKSAKLCKDYEGKQAVKITYEFTNNSSNPESFDIALSDNVYQNGVGLEPVYFLANDEEADIGIDVKIKPGVTKEVSKAYLLQDPSADLEVEIGEFISFDNTKVTTTVKIK